MHTAVRIVDRVSADHLDRRGLGLLGVGHLSVDLCQAAVPALLPFFVDERGYSYAAAGALVFAATVGSSIIQPLFGHAADRLQLPWLMPIGVLMAGVGIGLAGVAELLRPDVRRHRPLGRGRRGLPP